jgi:hypothetical protein
MKLFKTIDYYAQIFLIVAALAVNLFLFAVNRDDFDYIIAGYLIVGGWQVCSVIVNFMVPATYKVKLRNVYLVLLAITVITGIIFWQLNDDSIIIFGLIILFWSPVLAVIYAVACHRETKLLEQPVA